MGAGGSPKIIGIYGQILEMGHGSTTVHFWDRELQEHVGCRMAKTDRISHLSTVQVVLCTLRLCYVREQRYTIIRINTSSTAQGGGGSFKIGNL